jgi:ABC-type lipoprotein export system ATPase subunit
MNFKLSQGQYKSIAALEWENIPELVVITGKNGSGKTQLLELINWHFTPAQSKRTQPGHPFHGVQTTVSDFSATDKDVVYIPNIWQIGNLGATNVNAHNAAIDTLHKHIVLNQVNAAWNELAIVVETSIGKAKNQITKEDIVEHLPIDYTSYTTKISANEGLNQIFQLYYTRVADCRNRQIPEDEIKSSLGQPPWEVLNKMLDGAGFPYVITQPQSIIGNYELKLVKKNNSSIRIDFSDLSSGEKMLVAILIWMYNTGHKNRLPKLMLLDEPDAHLHPSLSKQFFDVIENVLVKEFNVRVILTTHSPSSVSMVSPEFLFEMSPDEPRIKRLRSKEYGINLLTDGLITVKSNTKYVLVEDEDDAKFYNEIFKIFKSKNKVNPNINVLFIASANRSAGLSGGCTVVRAWVEKFVNEGVNDVFQGLMDLDNGTGPAIAAIPTDNLHFVERYSLENYLLDPIIVYASCLHNNSPIIISGINLLQRDEHKVAKLEKRKLQKIADHIFSEIEPMVTGLTAADKELVEVKFITRRNLMYPKWFLYNRGHTIHNLFRSKYRASVNYDKLVATIIRQEFLPNDLTETFKTIQK